ERLHLRPFETADLAALIPIYGDVEVMAIRKLGVQTPAQTKAELNGIIDHWQRHGFGLWAVFDKQTDALLGECGLRYRDPEPEVEISYGLAKSTWGKGLATEASLAVLDYGFRVIGLEEVVAIAKASNLPSHRVMVKIGMHLDKTWARDGIDRVHYLVRAKEFQEHQAARNPSP
ncbi:MAG: GNAT family N-acetyltransferase, partial [Rhodospirillaceae bacterium]|nr:GNAT family N-acetyltransferase [Rhodospirillaceae bacterium]